MDLDFPKRPLSDFAEPAYARLPEWARVHCVPFLDAAHSSTLTRTLWLPGETWQRRNEFGEWCLLKRHALEEPESRIWGRADRALKGRGVDA